MKRLVISLVVVIATMLAIIVVGTGQFSADNKHSGHHKSSNPQRGPEPRTDGAATPNLIPDTAAYEIVFRLLSSTAPEDRKELRKAAYLKEAGFDAAEAAAISNAAYEYKKQVEPLDEEVDNIKTLHWPRPSQGIMNELARLQQQKETIIADIADKLQRQLSYYNPVKLNNHVGAVKRKIKGFPTALPGQKVSRLGKFFSNLFTVSAQAPGCDAQVYMYNNVTVSYSEMVVYGSGSYSMPYNNCGHSVTLSTQLWGPNSSYASGGEGTYINMMYGETALDGYFLSTTDGMGYCPVANESFPTGNQSDDETAAESAWVHQVYASNDNLTPGDTVTIYAVIRASQSANGTVTATFSVLANPSPVSLAGSGITSPINGSLSSIPVTVQSTSVSSGTKKGPVEYQVGIQSVPTGYQVTGDPKSVTVCFGPKVMGTCPIT